MVVIPVPVLPSPKFQAYEYGAVPPTAIAVKLTTLFAIGAGGRNVKLPDRGCGPALVKISLKL